MFSPKLQQKIDSLKVLRRPLRIGEIDLAGPFLMAPLSAICHSPFRTLMEALGSGGTISELVSADGINFGNKKTLRMLTIGPKETHVGTQLFGDDPDSLSKAAVVAQEYGPKFIDLNMGCPVRKVVTKGGGSALLKDPKKLGQLFASIKKAIEIPLTIKIRTGWDESSLNALEVAHIAHNEGVNWVAVHGRTRTQQYRGENNWDYIEEVAQKAPLPIIGNGDLHTYKITKDRWEQTSCEALMLGRGPLRHPFIFLESLIDGPSPFDANDTWEVVKVYYDLLKDYVDSERVQIIQLKKHATWWSSGYHGASYFRQTIFSAKSINEILDLIEQFFCSQSAESRKIDYSSPFMAGGHG